jgi:hypothetical protein
LGVFYRPKRTIFLETYIMNHRGYTGRWNGTYDITLRVYIAINNELSKLQMIDAFRQLIPYSRTLSHDIAFDAYCKGHEAGSYHAWNAAGKTGRPPAWPEPGCEPEEDQRDAAMDRDMQELDITVKKYGEFLPELMDKLERELATRAYSLWAGFATFCDECVGVAAEKVIAVVLEPAVGRIEDLKSLAERLELEPDAETIEEVREGLQESWCVVEERGV